MQTKRDILLRKKQEYFSDRDGETKLFEGLLSSDSLQNHLLNVTGIGGIGKSSLLDTFYQTCVSRSIPVASIDLAIQRSIAEVINSLYAQLKVDGTNGVATYSNTTAAIQKYLTLDTTLLNGSVIPASLLDQVSRAGFLRDVAEGEEPRANSTLTDRAPVSEMIESLLKQRANYKTNLRLIEERKSSYASISSIPLQLIKDEKDVNSKLQEIELSLQKGRESSLIEAKISDPQLVAGVIYRLLGKDDGAFYLNPETDLTASMHRDINAAANRICLIFDRYENASSSMDAWLTEFYAGLEATTVVVIAGRRELSKRWLIWTPLVQPLPLSMFPVLEIKKLLELYGIADQELVDQISEFSGGLPLAVSLAAHLVNRLQTRTFDELPNRIDVIETLVEVLLREVNPHTQEVLEVCAVLRWFTQESIHYMMPNEGIPSIYGAIKEYEFVRTGVHGMELHDRVRDFIQEDLEHRAPRKYKELHRRASTFYQEMLNDRSLNSQVLKGETAYHLLRYDQATGMKYLQAAFEDAIDLYQSEFCYTLLDTVKGLQLSEINQLWVEYFQAIVVLVFGQYKEASLKLEKIFREAILGRDVRLKALVGYYLGMAYWYTGQFRSAIRVSDKVSQAWSSIKYRNWCNRILEIQCISHLNLGLFEEALAYSEQLLKSSQITGDKVYEAWALTHMGRCYKMMGRWHEALVAFQDSSQSWVTDLWSDYGESYPTSHLGHLFTLADDLDNAEEFILKGLDLSTQGGSKEIMAFSFQNLARLEMRRGHYDRAVEYIEQSIHLSKEMNYLYYLADCPSMLGEALTLKGQNEAATAAYKEGLRIANEIEADYVKGKCLTGLYVLSLHGFATPEVAYSEVREFLLPRKYHSLMSEIELARAEQLFEAGDIDQAFSRFRDCFKFAIFYNWYELHLRTSEFLSWLSTVESQAVEDLCLHLIDYWMTNDIQEQQLQQMERLASQQRVENVLSWRPFVDRLRFGSSKT